MPQSVKKNAEERMEKAIQALKRDLATLRAGRANTALLDRIQVDYYGAPTPVNQLANISIPDSRTLMIQPWDKSSLADIEKAIMKSDIGLTPANDGNQIRLSIPPLTEERRTELVKMTKKFGEEAKVAIRNIRRDANDDIKKWRKRIFPRTSPGDIRKISRRRRISLSRKSTKSSLLKKKRLWKYKRLAAPPVMVGFVSFLQKDAWRKWNDQTGSIVVESGGQSAGAPDLSGQYPSPCRHHYGWQRSLGETARYAADRWTSERNEGREKSGYRSR